MNGSNGIQNTSAVLTTGTRRSSRGFVAAIQTLPRRLHARAVFQWLVSCGSRSVAVTDAPALVIAPHQDDETFGCGGLIALKRARNIPVHVVFLTDGVFGRSAGDHSNPAAFIKQRQDEAIAALQILGVAEQDISFLGYPDALLSSLPGDRRTTLVGELHQLLLQHRPGEVYVTHAADCHPDHEAAYALTSAAVQSADLEVTLAEYSIWMAWSAPLFLRLKPSYLASAGRLDIHMVLEKKCRAIRAYASQCATLPSGFLDRFLLPQEVFFFRNPSHAA